MQEIMKYLGKRVLMRESAMGDIFEATILEISPSGAYVQLMFPNKYKSWRETGSLIIIEELPEIYPVESPA